MKKGFSSVFTVLILSSMIFLCLVYAESAASKGAESCAEELCLLTGRSLLSEYKTELYDRYGIFMVRSYDDELTKLAEFYLGTDLALSGSALRMSCFDIDVSTQMYPGLNIDMFLEQVEKLGTLQAAENLVSSDFLKDLIVSMSSKLDTEISFKDIEERLNDAGNLQLAADEVEGEEREQREQALKLKNRYKESTGEAKTSSAGRASISASVKKTLPSSLLGYRGRGLLVLSGGISDLSFRDLALGEYVLANCSNAVDRLNDTKLKLETEYILYGSSSDPLNQKLVKTSLTGLRFSLNLFSVLKEPSMISTMSSIAALFPLIPQPLTVAVLASIWAGIETKQDIITLYNGGIVPVLKKPGDFATNLRSFIDNGKILASKKTGSGYGSYADYLRILLAFVPEEEKAARLMDVMQLNLTLMDEASFSFRDYAYGLDLSAYFTRLHFASNPIDLLKGGGCVTQTHKYK